MSYTNHHIANRLINWYLSNKRELPWRNTQDPYKIWLSEIILQQTRVEQGLPYYKKFIEQYPSVYDLAAADEQSVLRLWQGLGYYSRARNLHACAKEVVDNQGGVFPSDYHSLKKLKGIGDYTAAAIASFAFQQVVPVVDGNVFRVLSRLFGIKENIAIPKSRKIFQKTAQNLIDQQRPDTFNQAIMEFGAVQCTPKKPNCMYCPLQLACYAFQHGQQNELPVNRKKLKIRERYFHYIVLAAGERLMMKERANGDIWQGLFDFYNVETTHALGIDDLAANRFIFDLMNEGAILVDESNNYKHILTHQRIFAKFFTLKLTEAQAVKISATIPELGSYNAEQIHALPKPKLIENYLNSGFFSIN